jgi:hypothetical protein
VDARRLRSRTPGALKPDSADKLRAVPSLPPDAMVPESEVDPHGPTQEMKAIGEVVPSHSDPEVPTGARHSDGALPIQIARAPTDAPFTRSRPRLSEEPPPVVDTDPQGGWFLAATLAMVAMGLIAFGVRYGSDRFGWLSSRSSSVTAPMPTVATPAPSATVARPVSSLLPAPTRAVATTEPLGSATAAPAEPASATPAAGEELPLPNGAVLAPDQGLLDIETGAKDAIFIDGVELGRGPFLRLALAPGVHEVRVRAHGEDRVRFVLIRGSRRVRLALGPAWNR